MNEMGKIISGGQTGADRAALDWAMSHRIPHGGWCPQGRLAEDGPIKSKYKLRQTRSSDYAQRTEWNVRDSDGTIIFSISGKLAGGSLLTSEFARQYDKPSLQLSPKSKSAAAKLRTFIVKNRIKVLNVAGSRASEEPEIARFVPKVLEEAFVR